MNSHIQKKSALERIYCILDPGSFHEIGAQRKNIPTEFGNSVLIGDGVITGSGKVNNRTVFIYSQDFSVKGGTLGLSHGRKIANIIKLAAGNGYPLIGINDSGGARIQEGINSLAGYGEVMKASVEASGVIPQIGIIAGTCAGGAVYSPAIMDFVFTIEDLSYMYITGPEVVKEVIGEKCSSEVLGGANTHATMTGIAHFKSSSEDECYETLKKLLEYIPSNSMDKVQNNSCAYFEKSGQEKLSEIVPERSAKCYNMLDIIQTVMDEGFLEVQRDFAPNIITGFAKLSGINVGVVANQPKWLGGILDCDASIKAARFIRFCDAFNIPVITFVDVPGFMPGVAQERKGIIRHGAKLLYAYAAATVLKITVIVRKAYGGAYISMGSKHLGADSVYAWPGAEAAVMGGEGAVSILYRKQISELSREERQTYKEKKILEYNNNFLNANRGLGEGYIDTAIQPEATRKMLFDDLITYSGKKTNKEFYKKHGNIPL